MENASLIAMYTNINNYILILMKIIFVTTVP